MTSPNAVQSIDAAQVTTAAKRFMRSNKAVEEYEDSSEDPEDEERGINANVLDDVIVKAGKETTTNAALKKLVTSEVLKNAVADKQITLLKQLYVGKVSLKRSAKVLNYNRNSNLAQEYAKYSSRTVGSGISTSQGEEPYSPHHRLVFEANIFFY